MLLVILAGAPAFALLNCAIQGSGAHNCCAAAAHAECRMRSQRPCCAITPGPLPQRSEAQLPVTGPAQIAPADTAVLAAAPALGISRPQGDMARHLPLPDSPQSVLCTFLI